MVEEEAALFFGDGDLEFLHHLEHVLPGLAFFPRAAKEIGGVESGHEGDVAIRLPLTAKAADWDYLAEEPFDCGSAESHDHLRLNEVNLLVQKRDAGLHLLRGGFAVSITLPGGIWPAFQDVGDVHRFPAKAHGPDHFGQELTGLADKRLALDVLVRAWSFADEHQPGIDVAHAKDNVFA